MNKQKKSVVYFILAFTGVFIVFLIFGFYIIFRFVEAVNLDDWNKDYTETIPQKIGGELVCKVQDMADLNSWYISIGYYYKNGQDSARKIGWGGFQNVNWERKDQIEKIGEWYYLATGDGERGQKLLYGKLTDTTLWKEYYLSPDSVMIDPNWIRLNKDALELASEANFNNYNSLLVIGFIPSMKTLVVKGVAYRFKKRTEIELLYSLGRVTGKPILKNVRIIS